jgi:hypothetical protein
MLGTVQRDGRGSRLFALVNAKHQPLDRTVVVDVVIPGGKAVI